MFFFDEDVDGLVYRLLRKWLYEPRALFVMDFCLCMVFARIEPSRSLTGKIRENNLLITLI